MAEQPPVRGFGPARPVGRGRVRRDLTSGSIFGALLALAIPIVGANLLQTVYQLIDTFWVGRLGAGAVAAVSVSFPVLFVLISLGGGLAVAGAILVAQRFGAGDRAAVDHVAAQTLLGVAGVSVVLSVAGYLLSGPLMTLFAPDAAVQQQATVYLRISFLGLIAVFLYFVVQSLMRGVGDVTTPLWIVLGTVLLNFVADPVFILGLGPVPAMGVAGAAIATVAAQGLAAIVGIWVLTTGRFGIHLRFRELWPDPRLLGVIFRLGLPASMEQSARGLGFSVMMLLVVSFGTTVVAAYGIGMRILSFIIVPALGLAMATTTVVGQNVGAGQVQRAEATARAAVLLGFGGMTAGGVVLFIFSPAIIRGFVPHAPRVVSIGTVFIRTMALSFGFVGVQQVLTGALRGAGNTLAAMLLTFISLWVLLFPLAWVLSQHTGLAERGIWWAYPIANVLGAALTVGWFLRGRWQRAPAGIERALGDAVTQETIVEEGLGS